MIKDITNFDEVMGNNISSRKRKKEKNILSTRTEGTYFSDFRMQINLNKEDNPADNGKLSICNKKRGICLEFTKPEVIRLKDELEQMLLFMEGSENG